MTCVAEFTVPAEALPFGETLVENPDARIEVERIVPTDESAFPFFWVYGDDPERFLDRAAAEPEIDDVQLLERIDGRALFRANWSPDVELIEGLKRLDVTIVESVGSAEHWRFEVRARTRDRFAEFRGLFRDHGIPITLTSLYDLGSAMEDEHRALTPEQREALILAYREGYFENPRRVTQEELGEQFDISYRAVSDRLRRGTRNLVAAHLISPEGDT